MSNYDMAALFAGLGAYLVLIIGVAVFYIICTWRIFVKAGEPGWKCLIPIYGGYIDYAISWKGGVYFIVLILGVVAALVKNPYVLIAVAILQLILQITKQVKLGLRFGKNGAFGFFLLFLLPVIGYPILAFSSADYNESRSE